MPRRAIDPETQRMDDERLDDRYEAEGYSERVRAPPPPPALSCAWCICRCEWCLAQRVGRETCEKCGRRFDQR